MSMTEALFSVPETRIARQRRRSGTPPQGNSQHRIATLASMARTENDTWDLATSVGATATMVAAGRGRATRAGLIDDPYAAPLASATRLIHQFTTDATGPGTRQAVLLASVLDAGGFRLSWAADAVVFEID